MVVSEDVEDMGLERRDLLENLGEVMEVALEKYAKTRASNKDRQAWGRLTVSACEASAKIIRDADLESLKEEVEELRRLVENKH